MSSYVYLESIKCRECYKYLYMTAPIFFSCQAQEKPKMVQTNPWSDRLKYGVHTRLHFGSNWARSFLATPLFIGV